jgi:hypothetical protein
VENPYFQYFCGEMVFQHELPFDRSSLTRWRQRLGEEQIAALLNLVGTSYSTSTLRFSGCCVCVTMTSSHFNDSEHWRQQADEALARQLPNPEIQSRDDAGCCGL